MPESHSHAAPVAVGDAAPDFLLPPQHAPHRRLSELRGGPTILAFHTPGWDPARAEQLETYRRAVATPDDEEAPRTVLVPNDAPSAALFGVAHESAVFVLDAQGRIAWRHVAGTDSLHSAVEIASGMSDPVGETLVGPWTRREFVATALGAAVALTLEPAMSRAEPVAAQLAQTGGAAASVGGAVPVALNVNGQRIALTLEPRVTLLDALREYAGLTGSKKGCDHGQCGACTVHVEGRRVLSCLTLAVMQQGKQITTIEGLARSNGASGDALHPMQQAFMDHDGFQCGYCTSGQIMSAAAVVQEPWGPADDDVREAMSGNICRCGAYPGIVAAVQDVRRSSGGKAR